LLFANVDPVLHDGALRFPSVHREPRWGKKYQRCSGDEENAATTVMAGCNEVEIRSGVAAHRLSLVLSLPSQIELA
jgi:hypothetical protein